MLYSDQIHMQKNQAFTLIEILTTITLAALLMIGAVVTARSYFAKARDSTQKDDIQRIRTALYEYHFNNSCFPKELPSCGEPFTNNEAIYLANIPCRPDGSDYYYEVQQNTDRPSSFKLLTNLETETDSNIAEVGCQFGCGESCDYNYGVSSTNIRLGRECISYFACSPGGACTEFEDPEKSQCPEVFYNDPQYAGIDCELKENRCKNSSGKLIPED